MLSQLQARPLPANSPIIPRLIGRENMCVYPIHPCLPWIHIDTNITRRYTFFKAFGIQRNITGYTRHLYKQTQRETEREDERTRDQSERGTFMPGPPATDVSPAPVP